MKKTFFVLLGSMFLFAGMTSCKKDSVNPKTPEELNEEAKAAIEGKWERGSLQINGFKDGELVTENIDDEDIVSEIMDDMPQYIELTKTKFVLVDLISDEREESDYTLDAAAGTIILAGDDIHLKYSLTDKDTLSITVENDASENDLYDTYVVTIKLNRISEFPSIP